MHRDVSGTVPKETKLENVTGIRTHHTAMSCIIQHRMIYVEREIKQIKIMKSQLRTKAGMLAINKPSNRGTCM